MTGVTTFMIDKDIDTGGIILREECRISDTDTAGDIHDRLMGMGASLVVETVEGLIQGNTEIRVQRSFIQGSEPLKPAPKLSRELCHIDWNDTTDNIYNLIRGLSPYPAAFTELVPVAQPTASDDGATQNATPSSDGKPVQLKIYSAERIGAAEAEALYAAGGGSGRPLPGTVLSDGNGFLAVATADGALRIKDLQLAGKKRMDAKSFLLGFREPRAYVCVPGTSRSVLDSVRKVEA